MGQEGNISYIVAFVSGLLIFLSPCILPLIPSYIAYLTGISLKEAQGEMSAQKRREIRRLTISHSLLFIAGFTAVFVLLGAAATYFGNILLEYKDLIERAGGALIIFFGLYILGVIKIGFLQQEKQLKYRKRGISYAGSFLVGATFAAAWTPCVGPILASILVLAASTADVARGIKLLTVFSLGVGLPFFLCSLVINTFFVYFQKLQKYIRWVTVIGGAFLVVIGLLLLTGNFGKAEVFIMRMLVR